MLTLIRRRLTYTNIALTLALVFAMTGGAYAANKYLITSTKQISPKVIKSLQGQKGKDGTNGTGGPVGPQGTAGVKGEAGPQGPAGAAGAKGDTGAPGSQGKEGTKGLAGSQGPAGPTCSASGECLLPAGATETGAWSFRAPGDLAAQYVSISFALKLTSAPEFIWVDESNSSSPGSVAGCPGTAEEPAAEAGKLCVYEYEHEATNEATPSTQVVTPTSGITFQIEREEPSRGYRAYGSWAVKR